jgi:hypothetical protein
VATSGPANAVSNLGFDDNCLLVVSGGLGDGICEHRYSPFSQLCPRAYSYYSSDGFPRTSAELDAISTDVSATEDHRPTYAVFGLRDTR